MGADIIPDVSVLLCKPSLSDIYIQISFGISAFDNAIQGALSLNFDTSMSIDLSITPGPLDTTNVTTLVSQLQGCANLDASINLNVGADGDFLSFINLDDSNSIFEKDFTLFQVSKIKHDMNGVLETHIVRGLEMLRQLKRIFAARDILFS